VKFVCLQKHVTMYGMINNALGEFITNSFGGLVWEQIATKAGCPSTYVSVDSYDDELTFRLVKAAHEILNIDIPTVLVLLGEHWITHVAKNGYDRILKATGKTFPEFLQGINTLHTNLKVSFKDMIPPSFWCTDVSKNSLVFHYKSGNGRIGLAPLVVGMIKGLSGYLNVQILKMDQLQFCGIDDADHDSFAIEWKELSQSKKEVSPQASSSQPEVVTCPFKEAQKLDSQKTEPPKPTSTVPTSRPASPTTARKLERTVSKPRMAIKPENKFILPPNKFVEAFPFHMVLDSNLTILQAGPALVKVCPHAVPGENFAAHWKIDRPMKMVPSYYKMKDLQNAIFIITYAHDESLEFKGQFTFFSANESCTLNGPYTPNQPSSTANNTNTASPASNSSTLKLKKKPRGKHDTITNISQLSNFNSPNAPINEDLVIGPDSPSKYKSNTLRGTRNVHPSMSDRPTPQGSQGVVYFLGSPLVTSFVAACSKGLSLNDFALHDPMKDILYLTASNQNTLEDAHKMEEYIFHKIDSVNRALLMRRKSSASSVHSAASRTSRASSVTSYKKHKDKKCIVM